jgi:hypothetical protein
MHINGFIQQLCIELYNNRHYVNITYELTTYHVIETYVAKSQGVDCVPRMWTTSGSGHHKLLQLCQIT